MAEQAEIIRWEDPPPAQRAGARGWSRSRYADVAEALRANPGRWALVAESPARGNALATYIRMGHMHCFTPAGDFDSTTRCIDGTTRVYARYLGDQEIS